MESSCQKRFATKLPIVVYDVSTKTKKNKKNLDKCSHRRAVISEELCGLLLRFHIQEIRIFVDTEKVFLLVGLHEADEDVTRFLRVNDITNQSQMMI